ncbi:guanylate kinase [Marinilabilia salmonicolor]|jgi:guanylate kinase|uniref:guanylate kinase n=1 Tax=Marinilabilia salmonicolor TaxID=989 RepID=UPI000D07BF1C|nr:guanylate kinase [Marinilabilia salmonicolor]PRY87876.1 guanylate kinase [Marinilabilia salmonicolor]
MANRLIIFSAPSGSGKTTIVRTLMQQIPDLAFSISATSRKPRGLEKDGVDYYFLDSETFREKINKGEFLEWEEVYEGTYYGTLKSEVQRISAAGKTAVFDVDVVGATNIKKQYGDDALAIFVKAPTLEVLEERLRKRNTDTEETISKRLDKAEKELGYARFFDKIIINDNLDIAMKEALQIVRQFITQ